MNPRVNIAITTGDIDGIGLEITLKALKKLPKKIEANFFVYANSKFEKKIKQLINNKRISFILNKKSPAKWFEECVLKIKSRHYNAVVTGPMSKQVVKKNNPSDLGHTEIVKRLTKEKKINMFFIGKKFSVALLTGHIPLSQVANDISENSIIDLVKLVDSFFKKNFPNKKNKPIGILGLNPHAGDHDLIGLEDSHIIKTAIKKIKKLGIAVDGPLIPDVAFQRQNWKKYSCYISLYHDQGLIPFKLVHGYGGVQVSMGTDIIRTSVDHGTAKDIFKKNIANPQSMIDAIVLANSLAIKNLRPRKGGAKYV